MNYLLYNPFANNGEAEKMKDEVLKDLEADFGKFEVQSVVDFDVKKLLKGLTEKDNVVLFGGDGTLNRFVNNIYGLEYKNKLYLYRAGTGNDFLKDIADDDTRYVEISKYIKKLPLIEVNGQKMRFLNGIGYGVPGAACEVADRQKAEGAEKIDYTKISIKLVLKDYKMPGCKVTVDGVTHEYKKCWLASAMYGKYMGGGMMAAPKADRLGDKLHLLVWHKSGRLHTLLMFSSIFKGEHVKHTKYVENLEGKDMTVEFDAPCALQVDGETILNVTKYVVHF